MQTIHRECVDEQGLMYICKCIELFLKKTQKRQFSERTKFIERVDYQSLRGNDECDDTGKKQ